MQSFGVEDSMVRARLVLAENDTDVRLQFGESLRRAGHIVWEAADGAEALHLVRSHAPDLLLMGVWLPVLNGIDVLEQLAVCSEPARVRVVLLSPRQDADTRLEGYAVGVDDYWETKMPVDDICRRVDELLRATRTPPVESN
jgi:DNA-binding response OmpR family regulator